MMPSVVAYIRAPIVGLPRNVAVFSPEYETCTFDVWRECCMTNSLRYDDGEHIFAMQNERYTFTVSSMRLGERA